MANPATFSGRPACTLTISSVETELNAAANASTIYTSITVTGNSTSWNNNSSSWSATINGVSVSGSWTYDFRSNNTVLLYEEYRAVAHTANGSKVVSYTASASDNGGNLGSASADATMALTDFTILPNPPAAPTLTRTSDGSKISMSVAAPSSAVAIDNYYFAYSTNNSTWTAVGYTNSSTPSIANWSVPSSTTGYYIRAQAHSSEGWSSIATIYSKFIAGVPSAPASIVVNRTARDVQVDVTASSSTGGATITGYKVQYSTDNGSTWSTAVDMSGTTYTYTSLAPGLTYLFRAYAVNSTGSSAVTTSGSLFVSGGGKRFDGSTWSSTSVAKRYNGSAWTDLTTAKRYNGSTWVDLS